MKVPFRKFLTTFFTGRFDRFERSYEFRLSVFSTTYFEAPAEFKCWILYKTTIQIIVKNINLWSTVHFRLIEVTNIAHNQLKSTDDAKDIAEWSKI